MKSTSPQKKRKEGMTLLELTVVILVLLSLISILFIGARAWKRGSDRAGCIMNVRNCQQAIRSYANMNGMIPGATIPGGLSREGVIVGPDSFIPSTPVCPGGGIYGGQELTTIPLVGVVLMACTYNDGGNHFPSNTESW